MPEVQSCPVLKARLASAILAMGLNDTKAIANDWQCEEITCVAMNVPWPGVETSAWTAVSAKC